MFKWRQTEPELILCAVRWYLRYSLSFRDVEELLRERGLEAVGGEFVGIRHRSIFGSREPGVPREVVAMA